MEILKFIFGDILRFLGTLILLAYFYDFLIRALNLILKFIKNKQNYKCRSCSLCYNAVAMIDDFIYIYDDSSTWYRITRYELLDGSYGYNKYIFKYGKWDFDDDIGKDSVNEIFKNANCFVSTNNKPFN